MNSCDLMLGPVRAISLTRLLARRAATESQVLVDRVAKQPTIVAFRTSLPNLILDTWQHFWSTIAILPWIHSRQRSPGHQRLALAGAFPAIANRSSQVLFRVLREEALSLEPDPK
jgi:hypothetical protein